MQDIIKAKWAVVVSALMWAGSGTIAQHLFTHSMIQPEELTTWRLFVSGLVFLGLALGSSRSRKQMLALTRKDWCWRLPLFGTFGIFFMQYTYFVCIHLGTAAAATVLQYIAPIFIMLFTIFRRKKAPNVTESLTTIGATVGVYLLVTGGDWHQLAIPFSAFIWGLLSAFALAFYTIYPKQLLKNIPAQALLGIGMLFGSAVGMIFFGVPSWQSLVESTITMIDFLFIVFFGTVFPFYLYLYALSFLEPTAVGVLACLEPFAVVVFSMLFLHMQFGIGELIGVLFVILSILLLILSKEQS